MSLLKIEFPEGTCGLSGQARDLLDFIRYNLVQRNNLDKYYFVFDISFRNRFNKFIKDVVEYKTPIRKITFLHSLKELIQRDVILYDAVNEKFIYNFMNFGYVGNSKDYAKALVYYNIEERIKNNINFKNCVKYETL